MTRLIQSGLLVGTLAVLAGPLHAACYADYRARKDDPLRLHYGVIELSAAECTVDLVQPEIAERLAANGWELVQVVSVFTDEAGLAERRADAADNFLRY